MDKIEQRIIEIIEQNAERICNFGDDIWHHAELGYQEYHTSQKFREHLDSIGLEHEDGLAITGVKSYLKPKKEGEVRIALMGEFDALPFPKHPDVNPETGAAHCYGHNAQITGVMGASIALTDPVVKEALGGNIAFIGVPSEEGSTAPEEKAKLIAEGKIEFIRLGVMDDINLTVGHHVHSEAGKEAKKHIALNATSMGFLEKYITYTGIPQHPARAHMAVDAQAAALLAMGAGVEIRTEAGYLPVVPVKDASVVEEVLEMIDPEGKYTRITQGPDTVAGTTDFGDLSNIMPVFQFKTGGSVGSTHTVEFHVTAPYEYYITPAKCFALIAYRLLKDDAKLAKQVVAENKPLMTKEEYLAYMEEMSVPDYLID